MMTQQIVKVLVLKICVDRSISNIMNIINMYTYVVFEWLTTHVMAPIFYFILSNTKYFEVYGYEGGNNYTILNLWKNYKIFPIHLKLDFIDFFVTKLSPTNLWLSNVTNNMSRESGIGRTNTYIYKLNLLNQGC
jgi:hypothetical protein